jgi:hypothetical protein
MGEYATLPNSDEQIKLGTCEDLMYVTRADIEALSAAGWQTEQGRPVSQYLGIGVFRVALPRLYDVPGDIDTIKNRQPDYPHGYRIWIDDRTLAMISEVKHSDVYFHKEGVNFFVPCPMSTSEHKVRSSGVHQRIDLIAEGLGDQRRAIYRCPYCCTKFNLCGHAAQLVVRDRFVDQWCIGQNKLSEPHARMLLDIIEAGAAATV